MKRILLALAMLLVPAICFAQAEPFTLEKIMSSPFPSELTAAPAGNRIAWVIYQEGKRNIWVAEGPAFAARQLTRFSSDDGQEISSLQFAYDNGTIVFVRGGNKNSQGEVPNPTSEVSGVEQAVWSIAWDGSGLRKHGAGNSPAVSRGVRLASSWVAYVRDGQIELASLFGPSKQSIQARGQNGSPVWSPDGRKLAFVSSRGAYSLIAVHDVTSKTLSYVAPSVDRDTTPRWSPDSKSIAFVRRPAQIQGDRPGEPPPPDDRPNPWAIWVAELASGAAREVWRSKETVEGSLPPAGDALLQWAGDRLVFASEHTGWMQLYSIPAAGGEVAPLMSGECEFEHVAFTPQRDRVVYASNCSTDSRSRPDDIDRRHLWRVATSGANPELLTPGEGIEWAPVVTADGEWIAYLGSDARRPAMPYVRRAAGGEAKLLAPRLLAADFPSDKLVVPQQVITTAADGWKIHNQLFLPPNLKPGERRPAVVFMHGGPARHMMLGWHNRGYYHNAYALNQYLASRGYIVLSVNYRSGIMYGRGFRMAPNRGVRGASEYQDVVAAGKYLASRADVDPKRIGLWGGSYGGYLTALGLARDSDLFAAGVDLHGVHDRTLSGAGAGGSGERRRLAWQSSPVADMAKWRSPVLLVHGDDDRNVPFVQTLDLVARLRQQGVVFEQIVFPDEVHSFLLHRHWMEVFHAAARFFDRHLKATR